MNHFKISQNFFLWEFQSRDTGEVIISEHLVFLLQKLRDKLGKPLIIKSGYRTPEWNAAVGGAIKSKHMEGIAADCYCRNVTAAELALRARVVGFPGILAYVPRNFCHLDLRDRKIFRFVK